MGSRGQITQMWDLEMRKWEEERPDHEGQEQVLRHWENSSRAPRSRVFSAIQSAASEEPKATQVKTKLCNTPEQVDLYSESGSIRNLLLIAIILTASYYEPGPGPSLCIGDLI